LIALLRDERRPEELGSRARVVACQYDWAAIGERFERILEEIRANGLSRAG
jgi:hypothetical protein